MKPAVRVFALTVVLALVLPALAAACPLCKEAASDLDAPGGSASLGLGFYYSILLMIGVPFTTVATLGFLIFRSRRRLKAARSERAADLLPASPGARP